jgi:hypothetical protein
MAPLHNHREISLLLNPERCRGFGNPRAQSSATGGFNRRRIYVLEMERPEFFMNNYFEPSLVPEMGDSGLSRLLTLFPKAETVNIHVRVGLPLRAKGAVEESTINMGFDDTAIFTVKYPLYCGEALRMKPSRGTGEFAAIVVAMVPRGEKTAVAVKFLRGVPKWFRTA